MTPLTSDAAVLEQCARLAPGNPHGGRDGTLRSMILPLLHHGALIVGRPYSESAWATTRGGGSPYGTSQVAGSAGARKLLPHERELAVALGRRVADTACRLGR